MSNRSFFLDTSGWLSLLNVTESSHASALSHWLDLVRDGKRIVLTDWIIAETGNGLARTRTRNRFSQVVEEMLESPRIEIVRIDEALLRRALADYAKYADKAWGLVDCASFFVMRDRGISDAFTSDAHFEQAGFNRLLGR
jgi:predicted nucleic acid-binding protein